MLTGGDEEGEPSTEPEATIEKVETKEVKEELAKNTKTIQ
jgi:Na+-transporting NADH:ubiquinone oxidoreductase subunit E